MKKGLFSLMTFILSLLTLKKVLAVCPLCTIAVGAGVGFSRWLGINDSITGLWIGGLTVSMILWTKDILDKRHISFKGMDLLNILGYYILILGSLYYSNILSGSFYENKLLFGILAGSISFWFGAEWYTNIKENNNGHAYFPFQKVFMPILPIIILSFIFYFLTK